MAAKLKGLQAWCKQQCEGYRDVQVTNLTASFKSGLAFCAIIHRYRPDIIDYDSLSKENIFENNKLAFEVASNELGIAALLDAEDMVAMRVPDKLCIVTYVAQYYNYFRDKPPVGGPGVKEKVAVKRHTPKENIEPVHDTKRPTTEAAVKQRTTTAAPSGGSTVNQAKRNTFGDKCAMCGKKVYVLERHFEGTTLYHRRCIRGSQRASSFAGTGETSGKTATEHSSVNGEKEKRVPPYGSSSLLTQLNGGPKPYSSPREDDVGNKSDTVGTPRTSSLLTQLRGGPAPYKGEATITPQKAILNRSVGALSPPSQYRGNGKSVEKMDVDDDAPPPLPLSRVPPRKPPRSPQMTRLSTVTETAQPASVAVTEDRPKTSENDRKDLRKSSPIEKPEKSTVLSGLLHNLANVRQGAKAGTNSPPDESHSTSSRITQIKTVSPVSKPDVKLPNNESHVSTKLFQETVSETSPYGSHQHSEQSKKRNVGAITTQKTDSSHDLKMKINAFEHAKIDSVSQQGIAPGFNAARRSIDHDTPTSIEKATIPQISQPHSILKSTSQSSTNNRSSMGPTIIRPPTSILKNSSSSTQVQPSSCVTDGLDSKPTVIGGPSEPCTNTKAPNSSPLVSGNNFSAFNINDSIELDIGRGGQVGDVSAGKPAWQAEVASKIHKQSIPQHGKKESRPTSLGARESDGCETEWQKEARRRENARGGKYSDPERKHVHIIKVPSSRESTGSEGSQAGPAERVRSPVGSPTDRVRSPTERELSPAEPIGSPAGWLKSPSEQSLSPSERVRSPGGWAESPAEPIRSPAERVKSPTEQILSPRSPTEPVRSPAERVKSPTERVLSPTEPVGSPTGRVRSPTEHVARNNQLKRGDVFYMKDKRDQGTAQVPAAGKAVDTACVADGKTEWQVEAERRKWNRLHKDETVSPTPAPRRASGSPLSLGGATAVATTNEVERAPSPILAVDTPSRVRVRTNGTKTEWLVDAEKRKTARNGAVMERSTVEYTEVIIDNASTKADRPHVMGRENRVNYADVNDMKKVIRPETRFSFNSRDFKPATNQDEPVASPKQPPARPPTLPSRKNRRAPLPPTIGRKPEITPKRTVNAEKRMSPLEICRQLRHLDIELRDLEAEGRELEVQIRSGTDEEMDTSEDLMVQWFGLINQRNELVRKEADLMYRKKQQELEGIHEDVEYELRCLMDKPDSQKTSLEKTRESVLLKELLETVNMRNSIVDCMEEDRIRYIEEDQEIAEVLAMKSLGSESPPESKADTKRRGKKQPKKPGYMKPMAVVR